MPLLRSGGRGGDGLAPGLRGMQPERPATAGSEAFSVAAGSWFGSSPGLFSRCANPRCNAGWLRVWRSRSSPVFEGGWCCSPACTQAQVMSALSREMDARGRGVESHRHRIPLGLSMVEQGWITGEQLREALKAQKAAGGGRLGHWLVRQRSVSEQQVTRALGLQWSCPVLSVEFHDQDALTSVMPRLFLDAFGALPLRVAAGKILYLGFEDRLDPALALAVERITGLHVESGLVMESQFRAAHTRMLSAQFPAVELVEAETEPAIAYTLTKAIEKARPVEARLARVHECLWLRMWLRPMQGAIPGLDSVQDLICSAGRA